MRLWLAVLLVGAIAVPLCAANTLRVGYQQTLTLPIAGATAAYSVSSFCAEASASEGVVTIVGRNPGSTTIFVVTAVGVENYAVQVLAPQPVVAAGLTRRTSTEAGAAEGSYEIRFSSDPAQVLNIVDMTRREGDRSTRVHVANGDYIHNRYDSSRVVFPSLYYQISSPRRELTFLDQIVGNSPLTVDDVLVRGFHIREGAWTAHAGYTSLTAFQDLFLPTARQAAVGVGRRFALSKATTITPSFYYFSEPPAEISLLGRRGAVGSIVLRHRPNERLDVLGEFGVSHSLGFASSIDFDRSREEHLHARVRYQPSSFASTAVNSLRGWLSDADWRRRFGSKAESTISFSGNRYDLRDGESQGNLNLNWDQRFELTRRWDLLGGLSFAHVGSYGRSRPTLLDTSIDNLQMPVGLAFKTNHFGGSGQYSYVRNLGMSPAGNGLRLSASARARGWYFNGYFDRQTQVPSLGNIVSATPGLEDALRRMGLFAVTPQQVMDLLRNETFLASLGLVDGVHLDLSPVRMQVGGMAGWVQQGGHAQQLYVSALFDRTEMVQNHYRSDMYNGSYSRRLTVNNDLLVSASLLRSSTPGTAPGYHPSIQVSFRRHFSSVPSFVIPMRYGDISGRVFEDITGEQALRPGMRGVAGVEIVLDDKRRTQTDANGYYRFTRVPFGPHLIQANFSSPESFYFTTPSSTSAELGGEVNFGLAFSRAQVFGYVRNDAGSPLSGIGVILTGADQALSATTDGQGRFTFSGLQEGSYEVGVTAESVPPGYPLDELAAKVIMAKPGVPNAASFALRAERSLSGQVRLYDSVAGREVPVAGVKVRLRELGRESTTDAQGNYLFRELPAGTFNIVVTDGSSENVRPVTLGNEPSFSKQNDLVLTNSPAAPPPAAPAAEGASQSARSDLVTKAAVKAGEQTSSGSADRATAPLQDVLFDFASWHPRSDQLPAVDRAADFLRGHPQLMLDIVGYCDEQGGAEFNRSLSERRAMAIKQAFTVRGISGSRVQAHGEGETKRFCPEPTPRCWQQNRRVHLEVHP